MNKPILAVDCDLTVCPSDKGWYDWLKYFNGFGKVVEREDRMLPYNLSERFPTVREPHQYWRELSYDQFKPLEGSVEALRALSEHFDIVFISSCKGNHHRSKVYWLKEYFSFMRGFMATKEKWLMNASIVAMVDDRLDILEGFDKEKRIWFNTPYTQSVECDVAFQFGVWDDNVVSKICEKYL